MTDFFVNAQDGHSSEGARHKVDRKIARGENTPEAKHDMTAYIAHDVIGGPGAFVVAMDDPADYATALRRKIVIELSSLGERLAAAPAFPASSR